MISDSQREKLEEALASEKHRKVALQLAVALRGQGMRQAELYIMFQEAQKTCDPEDPRYDTIVDIMDMIWGGPFARGNALYTKELKKEDLDKFRQK